MRFLIESNNDKYYACADTIDNFWWAHEEYKDHWLNAFESINKDEEFNNISYGKIVEDIDELISLIGEELKYIRNNSNTKPEIVFIDYRFDPELIMIIIKNPDKAFKKLFCDEASNAFQAALRNSAISDFLDNYDDLDLAHLKIKNQLEFLYNHNYELLRNSLNNVLYPDTIMLIKRLFEVAANDLFNYEIIDIIYKINSDPLDWNIKTNEEIYTNIMEDLLNTIYDKEDVIDILEENNIDYNNDNIYKVCYDNKELFNISNEDLYNFAVDIESLDSYI